MQPLGEVAGLVPVLPSRFKEKAAEDQPGGHAALVFSRGGAEGGRFDLAFVGPFAEPDLQHGGFRGGLGLLACVGGGRQDQGKEGKEDERALEERGFESVWAPEHSHIPLSRKTPFPQGGDLPKKYYDCMDPFVSLTAAASETRALLKIENTEMSGCDTVQIQLGDSAAASNAWVLDCLVIPVLIQEVK